MSDLDIVVLAAGKGTRMKSSIPKVLHQIAGKPMLAHVIEAAESLDPKAIVLVVGHEADAVKKSIGDDNYIFVTQSPQLGTGHAVLQAKPFLEAKKTLILYGDVPCISHDTLAKLSASPAQISILTQVVENPTGYGRILRGKGGNITSIVEEKDASDEQQKSREINTGILCLDTELLKNFLRQMSNENTQKEYYLTDVIRFASQKNIAIDSCEPISAHEVIGVNSKQHLAIVEREYQRSAADKLMNDGVSIVDPARIDVRGTLTCDSEVHIDVGCIFEGDVQLGKSVKVGAYSIIKDSAIGDGSEILPFCHVEGAQIGERNTLGPYCRIRPKTKSDSGVKIGNFVEVKATEIGEDSKANHLAYVGDAKIGRNVNVGAGTITCNYDGANKYQTILEDDVFVGSDTQLVAPVKVGKGVTIAAGSTITKDVTEGGLAISRTKQSHLPSWKRPIKK
jgi:bifunctional UDP-N-acetylglucosamine pyrophosphorylase/glucosamine-1-phosphate N-acetyltransferase